MFLADDVFLPDVFLPDGLYSTGNNASLSRFFSEVTCFVFLVSLW